MNKNELKNGMKLVRRDGYEFYIIENSIMEKSSITKDKYKYNLIYDRCVMDFLIDYTDDLKIEDYPEFDIMKVYNFDGKLIWERNEIDWSKIKFGTKVIAWNDLHEDSKVEGLFLSLTPTAREPRFLVYYETNNCDGKPIGHAWTFDKCKLVEDTKEEMIVEKLSKRFWRNCKKYDKCEECKYYNKINYPDGIDFVSDCGCEFAWLLENYNITKK